MTDPTPLQIANRTYNARRQYVNEYCKSRVQANVSTERVLSPPTVGRSLYGRDPMRSLFWGGTAVWVDMRIVEGYDETLMQLDPAHIWSAVSKLMNCSADPTKDGVPYAVRRHLFSAIPELEERLFEVWYQQSSLWSSERLSTKAASFSHLFVVG